MKLYSGQLSMFGAKVEIALREKGVDFDLTMVAFSQESGYSPKHPEVVRVNPKQQVPVLIDGDVEVYDSTQIFEYLEDRYPRPRLWPEDLPSRAMARRLEHGSDEVFFPHVVTLMGLRATPDPVDDPSWQAACAAIKAYYDQMELLLQQQEYLAGEFGFADIAFYMAQFFAARHTVPLSDRHSALLAWRHRITQRDSAREVMAKMADYLHSINYPVPEYG